ncbi:response regulator transcription factor [Campylobacter sp. RM9344]|uniref:Response regulator transcription factor n=1 Tax=Campylobacter californiensis TaxID=1032243 RepID=A0AAW3ZVE8_9BACT|nr:MULTISPECIES: response regulator transcription factor [unclassified Campylobacter]MBE2983824.1 response regulator transcription factor [Campylobacter sp. RM6883]MBE2985612.1 response regulator transcription factor [Campylobacter sp. RM12919]MBE2987359.1 response regulator transcription factor [Campylobacter sp. RM12920]MBE2994362.1 response regulator transcription factor [Campylobacter sp. RM6913]MBE3028670.1 response regulator transcription factor [Campylobacter sp. RM9344]
MPNSSILEILSDKKVLCLEDEVGILKNLTETLELFFGEVMGIEDGLEALDLATSGFYDVLVFDITVPHMDGLEVIKRVRQNNQNIPIIILSSHTEQEYLWRAVELKITRFLPKPYDKEAFIAALKDIARELGGDRQILNINTQARYDFAKKIIYIKDTACHLAKSESRLLEYFLKNKNKAVTYEELFDYLWEFDQPSKEAIKTIVKELRKKLGKDTIRNLYGVGYICEI